MRQVTQMDTARMKVTGRRGLLWVGLTAIGCAAAVAGKAQIITNFDFTGDTPGSSPLGWTSVTPSTPAALNGAVVTNVSGDNAVNIYDYSTSANARLEQDFATLYDRLHLSLTFTRNANITPTTSTQGLYVTLGANGQSQGTGSNRAVSVRLFNDGQFRIDRGAQDGGGNFLSASVSSSNAFEASGPTFTTHTLDIFAYSGVSGGSGLSYTGPDSVTRVLDPHSYAVYIDNVWITVGTNTVNGNNGFATGSWGLYSGTNLGRLGLVTGGATAISGMDFLIDNIVLEVIPEPSTFALLGLGGLLLIGAGRIRRCRSR